VWHRADLAAAATTIDTGINQTPGSIGSYRKVPICLGGQKNSTNVVSDTKDCVMHALWLSKGRVLLDEFNYLFESVRELYPVP
jgi:hypothetical protein